MYTILHIDGSIIFKNKLNDICNELEIEYLSISSGEEIFDLLERKKINLIITFFGINEKRIRYFMEKLDVTKFSSIPVIMVTADRSLEIREKMFAMGVIDYIPKDIQYTRLHNYIKRFKSEEVNQHDKIETCLKTMSIAVLDDSKFELKIMEEIFKKHNILNVNYYSDPEEFLKVEKEYSIYLFDMVMPGISGEQVIMEIRKKNKNSIIITISSIDHYKAISNVLLSGGNDYIIKPFNPSIFMARLKSNVQMYLLVKELEEKKRELEELVITDGLTNLYNHRYIMERLEEEVEKAKRYKKSLSIILFDVDFFKNVNDGHGHQMGDRVLQKVAKSIKNTLRNIDIVGRYGGEEFIAILPETPLANACIAAERVRVDIENLKFVLPELKITVSGGLVEINNETAMEILKKADDLLYEAKKNGRNQIIFIKD